MTSTDASDIERRYHRSPCGLLATTPAGVIVEANETFAVWAGRPVDDLIGMRFTSFLDPSSRIFYETRHAQVVHLEGRATEVALSMRHADGTSLPVLINSVVDRTPRSTVIRTAVFNATGRIAYERDLLRARRKAESSEARVRILQDVSGAFGVSANVQEVADSFVKAAREAFVAPEASVLLFDDAGDLQLVAGTNPLWGVVDPIESLRHTMEEVVLSVDDVQTSLPQLAQGLRAARYEALSITPLIGEGERLGVLVCFFGRARDFDDDFLDLQRALGRQASQTLVRVRLQRKLEHLALHDPLTDIPNRQFVEQCLSDAIRDAGDAGHPLAIVFLDVDEFKSVNDTYGHAAGDAVLRTLAQRLRGAVRVDDIVGRIGGDEFVAICANADAEGAWTIAERIRKHSGEPVTTHALSVEVSVSVGLAIYDPAVDDPPTPDQLLRRADGAMYVSKEAGKDRISLEPRGD
ncbi:GGDEF domain-containing protein [Microbacterium sp. 18062]|uniref:sensor domain-containing diguanylate cyclase n=1 Tax=Microbacterium sp. 18062 TaxID=2681410 RepID=UPI00135AE9A7|nr:diguanylate cyclase [Microbacterium sp. 18062]